MYYLLIPILLTMLEPSQFKLLYNLLNCIIITWGLARIFNK